MLLRVFSLVQFLVVKSQTIIDITKFPYYRAAMEKDIMYKLQERQNDPLLSHLSLSLSGFPCMKCGSQWSYK